jgi:Zinc finger, C3HC4 type (RING finger)
MGFKHIHKAASKYFHICACCTTNVRQLRCVLQNMLMSWCSFISSLHETHFFSISFKKIYIYNYIFLNDLFYILIFSWNHKISRIECCICWESFIPDIICYPCRHQTLCRECARKLKYNKGYMEKCCLLCKNEINKFYLLK